MSELSTQLGGMGKRANVTVTEAAAVVLGPVDMQAYEALGFYVENTGSGVLSAATVQTAPERTGPWVDVADFGEDLAAAAADYLAVTGDAHKYVQVTAVCGAGVTTICNFWLCGRVH